MLPAFSPEQPDNPYGVYDLANNAGWVSVGTDHDTASFAVSTIRRWWMVMGKPHYPKGIKVTDEEFAAIRISRDEFHGEWNYSITRLRHKPF